MQVVAFHLQSSMGFDASELATLDPKRCRSAACRPHRGHLSVRRRSGDLDSDPFSYSGWDHLLQTIPTTKRRHSRAGFISVND